MGGTGCLGGIPVRGFTGLAAVVLLALSSASAAEKAALLSALESITTGELQRHSQFLADDTLEGREAGSRGSRAAAGYLIQRFEEARLKPLGDDGGYRQAFGAGYCNLLALLEGSDSELKREVILVGAHYDHVGYGSPRNSYGPWGFIHNGADDNASGVAGLLELIDACRQLPQPPRRSLLFVFWDGEEKGLLGSKHWVENPTWPLHQVACAINLDMIGRLRDNLVEVYGSRTAAGLRQRICRANDDRQLLLEFSWEMKENSDHYTFFRRGLPVLMFHTRLHGDYHRPSDDLEKLNPEGMRQVSRLLLNTTFALANGESLGGFRANARGESPSSRTLLESSPPLPAPRLGITWVQAESDEPALVVSRVTPGSPASVAGLRTGDRLQKLGDWAISGENEFRARLLASPAETSLSVLRADVAEPLQLPVKLAGSPVRVGLSWRVDEGEPGTAVIIQVIPGSPADLAGLRTGDRIYEANGRAVIDSDELVARLAQADDRLEFLIERRGQLQTLECRLAPKTAKPE